MRQRKKILKKIKNDIAYLGIRTIVGFFRLLPRKAALSVGSLLGRIAPFFARKDYNLVLKHLTIAFGAEKDEKELRRLARESFRNVAINFTDAARLRVMSPEDVKNVCIPHGLEILSENLAKGFGIIALTSHTGCWEILGQYLAAVGIPTAAIARRLYDPRLEEMLLETRTARGIKNISRGQNTRDIIRALKEGYLLGVLIDQDTKVKGVFVDFFGRPAHTATAPALLSLKYKAPIIPVLTYRDELHHHHVCIGEPLKIKATGDADNDILSLTALCSKITENFIRDHPEQWVWFHKRWKTKEPKSNQS